MAEEAPQAEYPYPKGKRGVASFEGVEKPVKKGNRGEYYYDTRDKRKKKGTYEGIEKPYKIGSDGSYYYNDSKPNKDDKVEGYEGVEQPVDRDSRGGYYYSIRNKKKKKANVKYGPKPAKVRHDGTYIYDVEVGETNNTFFFRGGTFGAPEIKSESGATFDDVYGNSNNFVLALEYDWKIAEDLFFKLGSGFTSVEGQGQFAGGGIRQPKEKFQFYIFPNTFTLSYKLQIWNIQYLTPYIEAGPGYFGFIENRSDSDIFKFDGDKTKIGGAFVATATAGLLISMSKFMSGTDLLTEYGATQAWFDLQYKRIIGLDDRKDFSSDMITGGFAIGF